MNPATKKKLKFSIRWGIAALGVWWVITNINFTDRVMVLDPVTLLPTYLQVLNDAKEEDSLFTVQPNGEPARTISRDDLWVKQDRRYISIKSGGGQSKSYRLLAVKPGPTTAKGSRAIERLIIKDPDTSNGRMISPSDLGEKETLQIASPYVEMGMLRMVREADRGYLIAAICILPISFVLTSVRWFLLLRTLGVAMGLGRAFVLNMVGAFYNAFMLGSTGGDLIKAYYASKHTHHRTRAVMSVVVDRGIGLLALILLGGSMAAYQWEISECRRVAIVSGAVLAMVTIGAIIFYSHFLRKWTGLAYILRRLPMQRQVKNAVESLEIFGHRPLSLVGALLLSFPIHAITILSATFAGNAFKLPLEAAYYWVVVPVLALVGAVPISPQGAGVMEVFAVQLTKSRGATISHAVMLTMSIRLVQIFWNLLAGLFVLRGGYHAPTEKEQHELEEDDAAPVGDADVPQEPSRLAS